MTVGFVSATPAESLINTQDVFKTVFGSAVNLAPSSINGVLIQELTNNSIQVNDAQVLLYSSIYNPDVTGYPWLDSICNWNNIKRDPAIGSTVTCNIYGTNGTVIPIGSVIIDANGNRFSNLVSITIAGNPAVFTQTINPNLSITPVIGGTYTISQQIPGWDQAVYISSTLGYTLENDSSLRYYRRQQLALNSTGSTLAVISELNNLTSPTAQLATPIIHDFYVYNNNTSVAVTVLGVIINPYTLYISLYPDPVSITSADAEYVAGIIANKISSGCAMQGSSGASFTPSNPNYAWVSIPIQWDVPVPQLINIDINISATYVALLTPSVQTQIINTITNIFNNGTNTIPPVQMGVTFYASQFTDILLEFGFVYYTITLTNFTISGSPVAFLSLPITQVAVLRAITVISTL